MNANGKRERQPVGLCPNCGMDSGRRVVSDTVPEKYFVICDSCGYRTDGYKDMPHATRAWNQGGIKR